MSSSTFCITGPQNSVSWQAMKSQFRQTPRSPAAYTATAWPTRRPSPASLQTVRFSTVMSGAAASSAKDRNVVLGAPSGFSCLAQAACTITVPCRD